MFPMAMIDAPLQENSGWHGYAMPRFPANRSRLVNTLILGVLLAGWHFPLTLAEPSIMVPYLLTTLASAFVTNWVYYNARESALLAILYHYGGQHGRHLLLAHARCCRSDRAITGCCWPSMWWQP